jgi:Abhydrolase family
VIPRARLLLSSTGMLLLLIAIPAAQQAAPRFDRLFSASETLADTRLTTPRDLDHPYTFTPTFATKEDWLARRQTLRQQILVAEGLWPLPERTPSHAVIHGKVDREGYTIENVFLASYPGHYVTGNLYRPKGITGKRPAVLSPYGHWRDGRFYGRTDEEARQQVAKGAEQTFESAKYPEQARCVMLARLGYVVFHYDLVGYADSQQIQHREGFTDAEAELRLQSFMGLQTWNSVRALDFLASLPDVDPTRLAVTGASGGGTQTIILDAIDDRPVVSFPAVMVSGAMQGGCVCENTWLLRIGTNNIEIAGTFAPKPMGMSAANDWTKDIMTLGLPELKTIYGLFGAPDKVLARKFEFEHNYNQVAREVMYNWFDQQFALGHQPSPIVEQPFVPAMRSELTVFDAAHPRPTDATDAIGLRGEMTRASNAQLTKLAHDPVAYRETVGTALRAIVNDPIAKPDTIDVAKDMVHELSGSGFIVRQAVLTRARSGELLPTVGLIPAKHGQAITFENNSIVIWTHPDGKRSLFAADGRTPIPAVRWLLDRNVILLSADVFLTGEFGEARRPRVKDDDKFAGYNDGYNRTVLANRVRDLLTLIAFADQSKPRAIHLIAVDRAGVWALLARALAGPSVKNAAIDVAGFDFTQVHQPDDEMMLPGGLKYGGLLGFAPVFADSPGATQIYRAPRPNAPWLSSTSTRSHLLGPQTTVHTSTTAPRVDQMVRWLIQR